MSYSIEGLPGSGLEGAAMLEELRSAHGEGVAAIGVPPEALIVDRKAAGWTELRGWLTARVRAEGFERAEWSGAAEPGDGTAVLEFDP